MFSALCRDSFFGRFYLCWRRLFWGLYYERLEREAYLIYRQSRSFQSAWLNCGLKHAEDSFWAPGVYLMFLERAGKETPLWIKLMLFRDGLLGRPPVAYYSDVFPKEEE